jgi:hypothetical protein
VAARISEKDVACRPRRDRRVAAPSIMSCLVVDAMAIPVLVTVGAALPVVGRL